MELIKSDEQEEDGLPETEDSAQGDNEPQTADRNAPAHDHNWLLYAALALVAAGIIVGLVFLARWIYHLTKNTHSSNKPAASQSQSKGSNNSSNGGQSGSKTPSNNGSSATNPNQPGKNGGQPLPNNGPGNVIGIFAIASFAAASLHYIISVRKSAKEN